MLLKQKYTPESIEDMDERGKVVYSSANRIDIADSYVINNVRIDERISIDPSFLVPWYACFSYSGIPQDKKPLFLKSIEKAYKNTNHVIFRGPLGQDPMVSLTILTKRGKSDETVIGEAIKYLEELEGIIKSEVKTTTSS